MAIATGSQIRPELSAVDYTPFLQASGQSAQMQAQGIASAVGGALKGFESIVQQQKENKQLDAEIKAAERFGNAIQPFLKDVNPQVQAQFGQVMGALADPNLSAREKSTIAKGIPQALNDILGMAELGRKTQDEKSTAQYAEMLNAGGGKIPSPVSSEALAKYTPAQKLAAKERYLRQAEVEAKTGLIGAQKQSLEAKDAAALQKAELAKTKALIEDAGNAMALGEAFDDSNMTPAQVRAARVLSEGVKKTTGLDEKNNYDAYKQALAAAEGMPLGPERQAFIIDEYLANRGAANPDFLKKISEVSKSPYQTTKIGDFTVVEANGTTRVIDDRGTLAEAKNVEKDQYLKLINETIKDEKNYPSWDKVPLGVREIIMAGHRKYPPKGDYINPAPNARESWDMDRATLTGKPSQSAQTPTTPSTLTPSAAGQKVTPVSIGGGWKLLPRGP
jgi:hypothetical protein